MCDRAHPRALPAVPGDGSHPSWALSSRVHEGLGYPASHCRTAYKVMPWPGHEQQLKTPASSTCAETVLKHGGDLLTPHPPYKGEGCSSALQEALDHLDNTVGVSQDVVVPEAQHAVALLLEPGSPLLILLGLIGVLAAI